jgi:hypothetical protein
VSGASEEARQRVMVGRLIARCLAKPKIVHLVAAENATTKCSAIFEMPLLRWNPLDSMMYEAVVSQAEILIIGGARAGTFC